MHRFQSEVSVTEDGDELLPLAERAHVPKRKITQYLLNLEHPSGKSKARFFISQGFMPARWQELANALREHARSHPVAARLKRPYGVSYVVEGELNTPSGKRPYVRSVWIVRGDTPPQLTTAYPIRRQR